MRRETVPAACAVRLPRVFRLGLYLAGLGLWLSGALWLACHYLLERPGEFGVTVHPLEPLWLALHGAFAFLALWAFGLLWGAHIAPGWSGGRRRASGAWLVGGVIWMSATGYLLYYLGNEHARSAASLLHWSVGLACPALFATHRLAPGDRKDETASSGSRHP